MTPYAQPILPPITWLTSPKSVKSPDTERFQGKALIDAAIHSDVKMFVYTSVDRQGDSSYNNPTYVPHSASKHDIEHYLVDKSLGTPMGYCILRPTAFMEVSHTRCDASWDPL